MGNHSFGRQLVDRSWATGGIKIHTRTVHTTTSLQVAVAYFVLAFSPPSHLHVVNVGYGQNHDDSLAVN